MRQLIRVAPHIVIAMAVASPAVQAEEPEWIDIRFEAGGRFDSGIQVPELDLSSGIDDAAGVIGGGVTLKPLADDRWTVELGYDYKRRDYVTETAFDRSEHRVSLFVDYVLSETVGLSLAYDFRDENLGGNGLLQRHTVRPSIGFNVGEDGYAIASYTYEDRDFDLVDARDADRHMIGADYYYFLRIGTTLSVGAAYQSEEARANQFDFNGLVLRASAEQPLRLGGRPTTLALRYSFDYRDYDGIAPGLTQGRNDRRHGFEASARMEFGRRFFGQLGYAWDGIKSDLGSIDGNNHQLFLRGGITF